MNQYPQFYRNERLCVKRESKTAGKQVVIPQPSSIDRCEFKNISTSTESDFDQLINNLQPTSPQVYERYLSVYYRFSLKQAARRDDSEKENVKSDRAEASGKR